MTNWSVFVSKGSTPAGRGRGAAPVKKVETSEDDSDEAEGEVRWGKKKLNLSLFDEDESEWTVFELRTLKRILEFLGVLLKLYISLFYTQIVVAFVVNVV